MPNTPMRTLILQTGPTKQMTYAMHNDQRKKETFDF